MKTFIWIIAALILALCCTGCRTAAGDVPFQTEGSAPIGTQSLPQTLEEPPIGSIGSGQTVLYAGEDRYSFHYEPSAAVAQFLEGLEYDPEALCDCLPQYRVVTASGVSYGIDFSEGYARCEKGQAALTPQQLQQLEAIVSWVLTDQPGTLTPAK